MRATCREDAQVAGDGICIAGARYRTPIVPEAMVEKAGQGPADPVGGHGNGP
jgi:hypothetical protein